MTNIFFQPAVLPALFLYASFQSTNISINSHAAQVLFVNSHLEKHSPTATNTNNAGLGSLREAINCTACNTQSDRLELIKFYNAANGPNWKRKWEIAQPLSNAAAWPGIIINADGCVTNIILSDTLIKGTLPDFMLPELQNLGISDSRLTGTIPNFSGVPRLDQLYLPGNQLSGPIPKFNKIPALTSLDLFDNQLTGKVPDFDSLKQLEYLGVNKNKLTGTIPLFNNMPNLTYLDLSDNGFTGLIPNFKNFAILQFLGLSFNQLSGIIPDFSNLPDLKFLYLNANSFISPMPSLNNLVNLHTLVVDDNHLTFSGLPSHFSRGYTVWAYAPQDSVFKDTVITLQVGQNLDIDLGFDTGVTGNIYTWYKDNTFWKTIQGNNVLSFSNILSADAGVYRVEVTNNSVPWLILYSRKVKLTVNCMQANASLSTPTPSICLGKSTLLIPNFTGSQEPYTLQYNNGQSIVQPQAVYNGQGITVTPATTTTYSLILAQDKNGCPLTLTGSPVTVTVDALPDANAGGPIREICQGSPLLLTASGGESYQWSDGGPATASWEIPNPSNASYTVTVTNAKGCTKADQVSVMANALPNANAGGPFREICQGLLLLLTASGGESYQWSNGGPATASWEILNPSNASYTVTVTNAKGCTKADQVSVTVNSLPNANVSPDTAVCKNRPVRLQASGGTSYKWSNGGPPAASWTVFPTISTTYIVTVTNQNNCLDTAQVSIVVGQPITAFVSKDTVVCKGQKVKLKASGGVSYKWGDGGPATSEWEVTPASSDFFYVTVTGAGGCTASESVWVQVKQLPCVRILSQNNPVCIGDSITLRAYCTSSYKWEQGPSTATWVVRPTGKTIYIVRGYDSGKICSDTASIIINPVIKPIVKINISDTTICQGGSVTLQVSGALTYQWSPSCPSNNCRIEPRFDISYRVTGTSDGCKSSDTATIKVRPSPSLRLKSTGIDCNNQSNGAIDLTTTQGTAPYTYHWSNGEMTKNIINLASGIYTVTVKDALGCTEVDQTTITTSMGNVKPLKKQICKGEKFFIGKDSFYMEGFYIILFGCDSINLTLEVIEPVDINAQDDRFMLDTAKAIFQLPVTQNDIIPDSIIINQIITPKAGNLSRLPKNLLQYTLKKENFIGRDSFLYSICDPECRLVCDTVWCFIQRNTTFVTPSTPYNSFSPNGDGFNDLFDPLEYHIQQNEFIDRSESSLTIQNEWGQVIYWSTTAWDGMVNGKPVPWGAYIYTLKYKIQGKEIIEQKIVNILR